MREEDPFPKWVAPSGRGPDIKRAEQALLAPCLLVSISIPLCSSVVTSILPAHQSAASSSTECGPADFPG